MNRTLLRKLAPVSSGVLAMSLGAAQGNPRHNDRIVALQLEAPQRSSSPSPEPSRETHRDVVIFGSLQYPANDPIEDRIQVARLDVCGGWWFSIYDGHGGWQAAEFAQKTLHQNVEVEMANRLGFGHAENDMLGVPRNTEVDGVFAEPVFEGKVHERLVTGALIAAFERTDRLYKSKVQGAFEVGFGRETRAGSCALGCLMVDGTLFCANLGDSRAVLGVNREAFNRLPAEERREVARTSSPTASPSRPAKKEEGPSFHVTEYLRKAAVLKAQGEKLDPTTEAKLREVLTREVQAQEQLLAQREAAAAAEVSQKAALVVSSPPRGETSEASAFSVSSPSATPAETSTSSSPTSRASEASIAPPPNHANVHATNGKPVKEESVESSSSSTISPYLAVELSWDHNCREPRERMKLEAEHPDESDVVVCKRPDACYIKGKLQPTRSFGDFYLKYSEFMRSPSASSSWGKLLHPPYTPPYITATPEVTVQRLRAGVDDFLVMGTDGLWDFLSSQEAIEIAGSVLRGEGGHPHKAAEALRREVLSRAAKKAGFESVAELESLAPGKERRKRHDDLTIVVVDLKVAYEFFWWG